MRRNVAATEKKIEGMATPKQAAEFLAISRATLYRMLAENQLPVVQVRRRLRIPWSALRQIAESAKTG